jgi:hypothetical protein
MFESFSPLTVLGVLSLIPLLLALPLLPPRHLFSLSLVSLHFIRLSRSLSFVPSYICCHRVYNPFLGAFSLSNCSRSCNIAGSNCPAGSCTIDFCIPGFFCSNASSPTPCSAGSYNALANQTSVDSCLPCAKGFFQANAGQTTCQMTEAGFFTSNVGATAPTPCFAGFWCTRGAQEGNSANHTCPARYFCGPGTRAPDDNICPAGAYCVAKSGAPTSCPSGSYNSATGLSGPCPVCPAGSMCPTPGTVTPSQCPLGSFNNATGLSSPCTLCTLGTYASAPGLTACFSVPLGCYAVAQGATGYAPCAAGFWCQVASTDAMQFPCQRGYYCPAGSSSGTAVTCPRGNYCPDNSNVPTPCVPGKYSGAVGAANVSVCLDCRPGQFAAIAGLSAPSLCSAGSYSDAWGSSTCFPTAAGFWGMAGATTPKPFPCQAGYFCLSGSNTPTQVMFDRLLCRV